MPTFCRSTHSVIAVGLPAWKCWQGTWWMFDDIGRCRWYWEWWGEL